MACEWAPEVFGGANIHNYKRWEDNEHEKPASECVRTCKVSEPTMQRMAVMTHSLVKEGVAFTLPYLAALLTKVACEEEGKDIVIS
eukprot:2403010-Amphidinium_carterae.1